MGGNSKRRVSCSLITALLISAVNAFITQVDSLAQQTTTPVSTPVTTMPITGGQGILWLSQFANPALVGSLYLTPAFPLTGFYPLYPGSFSPIIPEGGLSVGPLALHPHMGVAEMYTDNVFRTDTDRKSDFLTTFSPGIQAQLPIAGRHLFLVDYRTNIQYYQRNPSNDVQDQTASGRFKFDFPGGLRLDFQGEHKLGHDPRGSAVDVQALEVNKWNTNSFVGQAQYFGAQAGIMLNAQTVRWDYLNNNQTIIRNRLDNYAGLTLLGNLTPKTFALANFGVVQEIYDQNKNLDSVMYLVSTGARWNVTEVTSGEVQFGYQHLRFSRAQVNQPGVLGIFRRDRDSFSSFFLSGNLNWNPISSLAVSVQGYRTIQQTAVAGAPFFVATGANLSVLYQWTDQIGFTANLGYEQDDFSGSVPISGIADRTDSLRNAAVGLTYRAVQWFGASLQYVIEDRSSDINSFSYHANTITVSLQALF